MQNKFFYLLSSLLIFLTAGIVMSSCNKKFDAPPSYIDAGVRANTTIKELKTRYVSGQLKKITEDLIIEGVVVADDKSGNFYKTIAIQDATAGITVLLNGTNLYTSYPIGRKVYIKMNGLYLGDYGGLIQIGGGIEVENGRENLAGIASPLFNSYIIKGSKDNVVTPKVVAVDKLHDSLQSMLIQLDNMEFIETDTSKTYADAVGKVTKNLTVKPCAGNSLIVRTSGFANFAGINVPNGKGTLLSIYTVFNGTKQLVIRDTSDVKFNGPRCGQGPTTEMNIADLRALYTGTATTAPDGRKIRGVVISDRSAKNINEQNLIIQQADDKAGIMVRFTAAHTFDVGDVIEVNVSNQSLEEFNGTLQVNNVPNGYATKVGTGTITPRVTTLADALANFEAWESTLVKINETATVSGTGTTWSTANTFTVGTNSIKTFVYNTSTFATTAFPTTATSIIGYLNQATTAKDKQLLIRTTNDVVAGTTPPPPPPPPAGDFTVTYDFGSVTSSTGTTDPTPVPTSAGLTFSSFQAIGLATNPSAGGRFAFASWPTGATNGSDVFTGSVDAAKYYEVTITPASGKQLDLTTLTFKLQRSSTGPRQAVVRASIDNFAANLPASISAGTTGLSVVPTDIFQPADATTIGVDGLTITFGAEFTNVSAPIKIRFYAFNAEAATGTFSVDDVKIIGKVH